MRRLTINGTQADIDDKTAVGIDITTFDPINLNVRKFKSSNKFSIPRTKKNRALLGFPGEPQSNETTIYDTISANYYVQNTLLLTGKLILDSYDKDRFNIILYQKPDVFQWMQEQSYSTFLNSFLNNYLGLVKGVPVVFSPSTIGYQRALYRHIVFPGGTLWNGDTAIEELRFLGTYKDERTDNYDSSYITFGLSTDNNNAAGSHFGTTFNAIMDYVERVYTSGDPVDFHLNDTSLVGNVFQDDLSRQTYIRLVGLAPVLTSVSAVTQLYFSTTDPISGEKWTTNGVEAYKDKTLFDIFTAYCKLLGVVIDTERISGVDHYYLRRIDEITSGDTIDFSRSIDHEKTQFVMPSGISQYNYINHEGRADGVSENFAGKVVTCDNKNFGYKQDLMKIDSFVGNIVNPELLPFASPAVHKDLLDFSNDKSAETFNFCVTGGQYAIGLGIDFFASSYCKYTIRRDNSLSGGDLTFQILTINSGANTARGPWECAFYDLSTEYTFMDNIYTKPKKYKIYKYLSVVDVEQLESFKTYYVKELGGAFVITNIKGYNPLSNKPTEIELMFVESKFL